MSVEIGYLLRRAVQMPPHKAAYRAGRMLVRLVADRRAKQAARRRSSYGPLLDGVRLERRMKTLVVAEPEEMRTRLEPFAVLNGDHWFDLLGSGWVRVAPGMTCDGIEGVRFPPSATGDTPVRRMVTSANRPHAERIFDLIADPAYRPIDWRIDFRSGYIWPADTYRAS